MKHVLVIYFHRFTFPMRKTIEDHIFTFEKFDDSYFYFVNVAFGIPFYLKKIPFDLVLYQTTFLSRMRWSDVSYEEWIKKYQPLKELPGVKAILPQDEFLCTDRVCRFIDEFDVTKVFSVSPESEWKKIYPTINPSKVSIHPVLTGYIDTDLIPMVNKLAEEVVDRDLDISYRAWKAEYWLGRHGMLKTQIADAMKEKTRETPLNIDISTDDRKTFLGMDWYRFLLRSKYTIGVEGGSSILDFDGSVRQKVDSYMKKYPKASLEEVEKECFPGLDGKLQLFALSPRHLEACMTKTCQILVEGSYNGILQAGTHYIELKKDFSNIEEVLAQLNDEALRKSIIEKAYQDVIQSNLYTYRNFVNYVMEECLPEGSWKPKMNSYRLWYYFNKIREKIVWSRIQSEVFLWKIAKRWMPNSLISFIKWMKKKFCQE